MPHGAVISVNGSTTWLFDSASSLTTLLLSVSVT
ncbi:Uncharacterised protein [Mycobacterium tuberculosis]|nr:Uncharacterised protein [Mycobacterium tuberculosis]